MVSFYIYLNVLVPLCPIFRFLIKIWVSGYLFYSFIFGGFCVFGSIFLLYYIFGCILLLFHIILCLFFTIDTYIKHKVII